MGFLDQAKMAAQMMKDMDPSKMKDMMDQANEQIRKVVQEEIKKQGLMTRVEVEQMILELKSA